MDEALAGSLVNFASQMFTNAANTANMRETNQWNERLMHEQNAWNLAQWHRENEYNDPAVQIARLRSAGINPAYAINGGAVDSGEAYAGRPSASATMQASTAVAPQVDSLALAQSRALEAQANKDNADAAQKNALTPGMVKMQDEEIRNLQKDLDEKDSRIRLNTAQEQKLYADVVHLSVQESIDRDVADAQIQRWNSQNGLDDAMKLKTTEEYNDLIAFRELKKHNLTANTDYLRSMMGWNDAQIAHLQAVDKLAQQTFDAEYGPEGMKTFEKELLKSQKKCQDSQAGLYDEQKNHPEKFQARVKKVHHESGIKESWDHYSY